jgi:electron transfer flavoprotein alpha subunit
MNQDIYVVIEHLRGQVADISYMMMAAAHDLSQWSGGQVIAVLLGKDSTNLSNNFKCDQVFYIDHPLLADFTSDAYQKTLYDLISDKQPRAVLIGHTSIGTDIAGVLSARLESPLVSSCSTFTTDGKLICQICGGKIMAEGSLPETTTLITVVPGGYKPEQGQGTQTPQITTLPAPKLDGMRISLLKYIEPESGDVDISREPLLISVGRGIQTQDNVSLAEDLANAVGGIVCASRPVVDQGWLPISRLVGKSGKVVKPKVYLTIGISGAPEHVEAIMGSETIIAINTDANAPIFNLAKFGTTTDLFDLVPVLTEKILAAK